MKQMLTLLIGVILFLTSLVSFYYVGGTIGETDVIARIVIGMVITVSGSVPCFFVGMLIYLVGESLLNSIRIKTNEN